MSLLRIFMGGVAFLHLSLSSEPQEKNYFTQDSPVITDSKATTFSFPPQDLCTISIDEETLVQNYNTFINIIEQLSKIEIFEHEDDLLHQGEDVIFQQQPTAPDTCQTCNRPLKLTNLNSNSIYLKLRLYFGTFGGSATVSIKSKDNKPVGEDDLPILALGKFVPDNPGVVFTKDKLQYKTQNQEVKNCLCLKPRTTLSPSLQRFQDQLQAQVLILSAFEPDLKIIITNLIRTLTNKTITYSPNGEATLTENTDSEPGCYVIKIKVSCTIPPTQLPFRVTPNSIGDISKTLSKIIHTAHHFVKTLTHSSLNAKPSLTNYITASNKKTSIADAIHRISEKNPSNSVIIILLSILTITVGLLILAPTLLLIVTRRGIINIVRNTPSQNNPALRLERQSYPTLINNYTHA